MKTAEQFIRDHLNWLYSGRIDKPKGNEYNLRGADFTGADLEDADFCEADLFGTNFTGADLEDADFTGANIGEATIDLYEEDIIALTEPLFRLMEKYNKEELVRLIKEM